jgi:hypothetical protein
MQRNPTTSQSLTVPGRFGAVSRPDRAATYPLRAQVVPRPTTHQQTERPTLFASLCRCLVRARRDQPVGGDVSPLLWW